MTKELVTNCFYSKLVRLEGQETPDTWPEVAAFLFQTGSIRRNAMQVMQPDNTTFLFQTGSIRRLAEVLQYAK